MDGLTVFWTRTAKKQRDKIFDHWNKRNKSLNYSRKLNIAIRERTTLLRQFPEMGKPTNLKTSRAVTMGHYSFIYQKRNLEIIIIGFWDNS